MVAVIGFGFGLILSAFIALSSKPNLFIALFSFFATTIITFLDIL